MEMIRQMESSGCGSNVVAYNILIHGLCKSRRALEAVEIKKLINLKGVKMDVITYCTLVLGSCKVQEFTVAQEIMDEMLDLGLAPSEAAVSSLVDGLRRGGNVNGSYFLVTRLSKVGVAPNLYVYNALINSLSKDGKLEEAEELFKSMEERGLSPNDVTYSIIIDSLCKNGKLDEAFIILGKMTQDGINVTVYPYSSLIDGYCKLRKLDAAESLYNEMIDKGLTPTVVTYTALIDGYCKEGQVYTAFRIYHEMTGKGISPNTYTFTVLISGLCRANMVTEASKLLPVKVGIESPMFLERIHGDICRPIHPPCGPFRYFMVLIDASSRWSHVNLLSTRNLAFARLLAQIIRLRAQFPDYSIKNIRLDNAGEYSSHAFDSYCMSIGISVEHPVAYVHTQNGLAESFIKRLQLIARPLLMRTKLPSSAWGHAILHAAALVRIRPTSYHEYSPLQLTYGHEPNISYLRIFSCAVYVPIAPSKRTKMGPQKRLGIYIGYESPSIIRYLEPMTGDVFTARFADCHFDETMFPALGGENKQIAKDISWRATSLFHLDPRTNMSELEVHKIIHLQNLANQLPDVFTDSKRVTKSHIPAANAPIRIDVPVRQSISATDNEIKARRKRGRPLGSKDKILRKRKSQNDENNSIEELSLADNNEKSFDEEIPQEVPEVPKGENEEISINFANTRVCWNRVDTIIDNNFAYNVALNINEDDEDPKSIEECRYRNDWDKWKDAIQYELNSLSKRKVFGPAVQTPGGIIPVGHKWVFVRKRNEKNEVVRYKARLVAQGFSQRPGIDYDETYSPVMDAITFRYLMSLVIHESLELRLMDVVAAYLYGNIDSNIYMKIPEGYNMPEAYSKSRELYSIQLKKSLYGLKQSGRMWYNRLSEYLLNKGYKNDPVCPCIFIKRSGSEFVIIAVYVDDLNIIGTPEEILRAVEYLKNEFEMKDFGKTKLCLGLQIEHLKDGIFLHQSNYTEKVLKRFYMDKAHPLSSPMVVRCLDINKDPFRPREDNEELLGPEVPYLSAIGALMYLANNTRPDISFAVNLLARYSSYPTRRHWNGIKHILRYLKGSIDRGLFYPKNSKPELIGYADAGYLSDPHKARSQTGYVFTCGGTAISWRSMKQTLAATSSNHAELIAIHEASRECVWLRAMIHNIRENCGLPLNKSIPTILYEDNAACIAQLKGGYIKGDRTKHISPKFFFTHELQKNGEINIQQIRSCENPADLFTKALPTATFEKMIHRIGMRRLQHII